jgi:integrase
MHLIFERYLTLLDQRQRDIKTLRANRVCLKHLDTWFGAYGIDPATPTDDDLQTFFAAQSHQFAYNTVKNRLTIVRSFYAWATKQGMVERNPVTDVKIGRAPEIEPETLSNDQLRAVMAACRTDREYLLFMLLTYTGMRKEEILTLKWQDIDWKNQELKVIGKFKKFRKVPIHPALAEALNHSMFHHRREGQLYVLETNRESRISPPHFQKIWTDVLKRAGVELGQPAHAFRKTVATVLYERGAREDYIDRIMGWAPSSVRSKHYSRVADNSIHEAILRLYQDDPIVEVPVAA